MSRMSKNRVNWVEPGDFLGYMMAWHDEGRDQDDFVPPIVWMHNKYDRSPSEAFFIESEKWGPLNGTMAHISYGTGKVYRDMYETTANGLRRPMPFLIKVSKDGTTSDIIANGFRAPNGLWVSPGGDFFLTTA